MRGIRRLGLCIVAVLALSGLLATMASAETLPKPVWASCQKASPKDTGKYKNKTCSEAEPSGKGGYELVEGVGKGKAFKGKTAKGEKAELIAETPILRGVIECAGGGKDEGTPGVPNLETKVSASFSKCEFLGAACTSTGAKTGEMKVTGLTGELGYIEEGATPKVGVELKSETEGGTLAKFECFAPGEHKEKRELVHGSLFGEVIGEETKQVATISKESEALFEPGKFYGEHEFEEKPYFPEVNIVGFAQERPEIERCEAKTKKGGGEECEGEHPAHVLKGEFCGAFIEENLHVECTPPVYLGLKAKFANKGETLEIKV